MSHRAIVSRRAVLSWGAVSLATLVSSCAGLPSNDKVTQHSSGLDVKSVNTSPARAPGPLAGATPEAIIEGFVRAGVDSIELCGGAPVFEFFFCGPLESYGYDSCVP